MIKIWTDGSCTNNGMLKGVGGWSYYIETDLCEMEDAGGMLETTNNRMEMEAIIQALRQLYETKHIILDREVMFYCDSELIVKSLCKNASYEQKKNLDKWNEIEKLMMLLKSYGFDIDFQWVKAHTNADDDISKNNKRVDRLATVVRDKMKKDMETILKLQGIIK